MFSRFNFDRKPACDGRTDGRTERHLATAYTLVRIMHSIAR